MAGWQSTGAAPVRPEGPLLALTTTRATFATAAEHANTHGPRPGTSDRARLAALIADACFWDGHVAAVSARVRTRAQIDHDTFLTAVSTHAAATLVAQLADGRILDTDAVRDATRTAAGEYAEQHTQA